MRYRFELLVVLLVWGCGNAPPPTAARAVSVLPAITVETLQGKPLRLQELTAGKVALIAFWAPWCEACAVELPALDRLSREAERQGALVVGVAVGGPRADVLASVAARRPPYPQLIDPSFRLADALGQRSVPSTLVVDRDGRIVHSGGVVDRNALAKLRDTLASRSTREPQEAKGTQVIEVSALPVRGRVGGSGELRVRLIVARGYHVMSNRPSEPHYIPTRVMLASHGKLEWSEPRFPPAEFIRFSGEELATFRGELTVRVPFKITRVATPGVVPVEGVVGYQACTEGSCLFPRTHRFTVDLSVEP